MDRRKAKALEAEGWKVGTIQELLDMSDEDVAFVEMKISLAEALRSRRQKQKLSQTQLAARMGSSQARVAKMEKGEASIDLLILGLLAAGASRKEIARKLAA